MRAAFALLLVPLFLHAQQPGLRVAVIAGQDAINNLKQRINPEPVVEIQADGKPVPGAAVTFFLPSQGPGGTFANGTNTMTVTTDALGRASARGIHFNSQPGKFEIRVAASYQGQTAAAVITQTNVAGVSTSGGRIGLSTRAWIILGIAGGVVAGTVIAATHGGSSSSNAPIVITPGTPSVGGPR